MTTRTKTTTTLPRTMRLLSWLLHLPRYTAAHLVGQVAMILQFFALAVEGLSEALADLARWLGDVHEDEDDDQDQDDGDGPRFQFERWDTVNQG